jgi:hypothetical protein
VDDDLVADLPARDAGPAAMTRTITSNAAGSGTSISSSWNASSGSPSRSWRMTHAVIRSGSVPGSVSTAAICVTSTAMVLDQTLWKSEFGVLRGAENTPDRVKTAPNGRVHSSVLRKPWRRKNSSSSTAERIIEPTP